MSIEPLKRWLVIVVLLLPMIPLQAEESVRVTIFGKVADSLGRGIPYCTVSLLAAADSTVMGGVVTDPAGKYRLPGVSAGTYLLNFAHVSCEERTERILVGSSDVECNVLLRTEVNRIDAVEVVAHYIERDAGNYVVTMTGNPLAKDKFLPETLELLPGMRLWNDSYTFNGRAVSAIYIDDRPASVAELRGLPSEMVRDVKIEPYGNSSEGMSGSGAVLRVRLKKMANGGCFGSVESATVTRDEYFEWTRFSVPFYMRVGNFCFSNQVDYNYTDEQRFYYKQTDYQDDDLSYSMRGDEHQRTRGHYVAERLNMTYELTPKHMVGVYGSFQYSTSRPNISSYSDRFEREEGADPVSRSGYRSFGELASLSGQVVAMYVYKLDEAGSEVRTTIDYLHYNLDRDYQYRDSVASQPASVQRETTRPFTDQLRAQTRLRKKFGEKWRLESGLNYYLFGSEQQRDVWSDGRYDDELSSLFSYTGQGVAAYGDVGFAVKQLSVAVGARLQWDQVRHTTRGDDRWLQADYWRLAPRASATYVWNQEKGSSVSLFYDRRSGAIPYGSLSPLRVRQDEYRYTMGNPDLQPDKGYGLGASVTLRNRWTLSYDYSSSKDQVMSILRVDSNDPRYSYFMPENCGFDWGHGVSVSFTSQLTPWWYANWEVYGSYSRSGYQGGESIDRLGCSLWLANAIRFTDDFGMTVRFHWQSPSYDVDGWLAATYALDVSIYKQFFKKQLYVCLEGFNLLGCRNASWTWNADRSYRYYETRSKPEYAVRLTLRFMFNNYRSQRGVTQTETLQSFEPGMK